jgi:ornithine cyclodeaminase/alanine dehydrogenase-like protein (mu-crystallin family)
MSALLLSRPDIAQLMTPTDYFAAVETGFRLSKQGLMRSPAPMHADGVGGAFHAKSAVMMGDRKLAAIKLNGNFPGNPMRGLPTIRGVIVLSDAETGEVLALMDSIEITLRRTAAASALAATHLARPDSKTFAVVGFGAQARPQVEALAEVLPFERGWVWDIDNTKASSFAVELSRALGVKVEAAASLAQATRARDVIVTCTTARAPFLESEYVSPGAFVAAVGADSPEKSEIAPILMAEAAVVADVIEQCAVMGDLHHAIAAGAMTAADVHADLGDIVVGGNRDPGRCQRSPRL